MTVEDWVMSLSDEEAEWVLALKPDLFYQRYLRAMAEALPSIDEELVVVVDDCDVAPGLVGRLASKLIGP
jgi:hypothetical protein